MEEEEEEFILESKWKRRFLIAGPYEKERDGQKGLQLGRAFWGSASVRPLLSWPNTFSET